MIAFLKQKIEKKIKKIKFIYCQNLNQYLIIFQNLKLKKLYLKLKTKQVIKILKGTRIKINLKNIKQKYREIFNHHYSLMTFSHILRCSKEIDII